MRAGRDNPSPNQSRLFASALVLACGLIPAVALMSRGWDAIPGTARSDFEFYFLPQLTFLARSLDYGYLPFWNPHLFSGYPVLEIQQSALFYPFRTVLLTFVSPEHGLLWLCVAFALVAPLICFASLRSFAGTSRAGSAVGCCLFSLGAFMALRFHAGHLNYLSSLVWMPVAVLPLASPNSRLPHKTMVVAGVGLALMILGGATQAAVVSVWAQLAVSLTQLKRSSRLRVLSVLCGIWGLAALISAPQWLPTLFYLDQAQRSVVNNLWNTGPMAVLVAIAEFGLRYPLGDGMTRPHLQQRGIWDTSAYIGAFGLMLVVTALAVAATRAGRRDRGLQAGVAMFVLGWYLSAGGYLPGFASFREPLKSLCLVSLGSAVLAAKGFDYLWSARHATATSRQIATIVSVFTGVTGIALWAFATLSPGETAKGAFYLSEAERAAHPAVEALRAEILRDPSPVVGPVTAAALWLAAFAVLFVVFVWCARRLPNISAVLLACGLAADLAAVHWPAWVPGIGPGESGWPEKTHQELKRLLAEMRLRGDEWRAYLPAALSNSAQRVENLAEPYGYDPLMPRMAIARSYSTLQPIPAHQRTALKMRALGVRYAVEETSPTQPETVAQRHRLLAVREVLPDARVATLTSGVILADGRFEFGPLDGIHDWIEPDDAGRVPPGLIQHDPQPMGRPPDPGGMLRRVYGRNPNALRYDLETSAPALLIVRHTWLRGWTVRRDREAPSRPLRINGWMMGVPVRADTRTVMFEYQPVALSGGLFLCVLGCLTAVWLLCRVPRPADST